MNNKHYNHNYNYNQEGIFLTLKSIDVQYKCELKLVLKT